MHIRYNATGKYWEKENTPGGGVFSALDINFPNNVGIGTTAPATLLHVLGNSSTVLPYLQLTDTNVTYAANFRLGPSIGPTGGFGILDITANVIRLVIDNAGNVGIGTTVPDGKLDVNGLSYFRDAMALYTT